MVTSILATADGPHDALYCKFVTQQPNSESGVFIKNQLDTRSA